MNIKSSKAHTHPIFYQKKHVFLHEISGLLLLVQVGARLPVFAMPFLEEAANLSLGAGSGLPSKTVFLKWIKLKVLGA